jgi:class 3 adenylate cyclase
MRSLYEVTLEHSHIVEEELAQRNRQLQTLSENLSVYLDPNICEAILKGPQKTAVGASRKKLTILFADIVDFTRITDALEPEELCALLNEYLTEVSRIIERHGATLNKFIGDAIVAFFGDPVTVGPQKDAVRCVEMALDVQRGLRKLRSRWLERGVERPFHCRIGINTGYCTVGNFGSAMRMDYTAIGGEVNLSARIQGVGPRDGVLISHSTWALVHERFKTIETASASVKGFSSPIRLYQVLDDDEEEGGLVHHRGIGYDIRVSAEDLTDESRAKVAEILTSLLNQPPAGSD